MDTNPYAAPLAELQAAPSIDPDAATREREAHIGVERGLKSVGLLYLLSGGLLCFGLVAMLLVLGGSILGSEVGFPGAGEVGLLLVVMGVYAVLGPGTVWVGLGLRRRNPMVRVPATILAVLSLASVPVGTLLGGYLLYLLWTAKGRRVFEPDYQQIVAATPHVVLKTSPVAWAVLGVVVVSLIVVFVTFLMG